MSLALSFEIPSGLVCRVWIRVYPRMLRERGAVDCRL